MDLIKAFFDALAPALDDVISFFTAVLSDLTQFISMLPSYAEWVFGYITLLFPPGSGISYVGTLFGSAFAIVILLRIGNRFSTTIITVAKSI